MHPASYWHMEATEECIPTLTDKMSRLQLPVTPIGAIDRLHSRLDPVRAGEIWIADGRQAEVLSHIQHP